MFPSLHNSLSFTCEWKTTERMPCSLFSDPSAGSVLRKTGNRGVGVAATTIIKLHCVILGARRQVHFPIHQRARPGVAAESQVRDALCFFCLRHKSLTCVFGDSFQTVASLAVTTLLFASLSTFHTWESLLLGGGGGGGGVRGGGCWNSSLLPFAEDGVASIHLFYMLPPTLMMGLLEPLPAVMVRRQGYILEKSSQGHLQRKNHSHWHTYEEFRVPNWPEMHVPVRGSWTTRTEATQTQGGQTPHRKGPGLNPQPACYH